MADITVEEMWKMALPAGTTLVAGEAGLSREVTWPVALRTRPPAFESVKGGEIALVSTAGLRMLDERLTLTRVINSLGDLGVAAVAVIGEIGEDSKEASESYGMAIFSLPSDLRLQEVERAVTRTLADRRMELHQRGQELQRQLTDLIIEGHGLGAIVERVSQVAGKPAAMGDERSGVRHFSNPLGEAIPHAQDEVVSALESSMKRLPGLFPMESLSASDPPRAKCPLSLDGLVSVAAPIIVKGTVGGYFWVMGPACDLSEMDGLAASRAAAACALELAKELAVSEAEDRLQGDLLEDLLSGNLPPVEALRARAERLGWNLDQPCIALVFEVAEDKGASVSSAGLPKSGSNRLAEVIERRLARRRVQSLVGSRSDKAIVLYPHDNPSDLSAMRFEIEGLRQEIASQLGESGLSAGVGSYHAGLSGQRESYQEAEQALAMGIRLFGPGRLTYFGDLGIYRLLFRMHGMPELLTFYDSALGKILEYERKNGAEFIKTLEAYFACRNSPTEAAEVLHLHRNTLLYRLQRIEEIAGIRLDDPETRLALHLALRIRETLQAVGD